ncbi:MAG: zinc ribbon domain-containing protein [Caldilineaceae bacterium]|nr:zinc ribbon domain-containing protein [Caldilineaceae bacterium]
MAISECPHCGYSNPVAAQFCVQCGTILAGQTAPPAPSGESADEPGARTDEQEEDSPQPDEEGAEQQPPTKSSDTDDSRDRPHQSAEEDETVEDAQGEEPRQSTSRAGPLLREIGGLLEPVDPLSYITSTSGADDPTRDRPAGPSVELSADEEERRHLRRLFSEELPAAVGALPDMTATVGEPLQSGKGLQRRYWLELILLLGMAGALLWGAQVPRGGAGPHALPGLDKAHRQIDSLQPNSLVLVNWAYDPATAGEMDHVAQPLIEHLLRRQAKLIVFSQLPGGPATARRVIARAEASLQRPSRTQITANLVIEGGFLPGGGASLPLLGAAPARALPVDPSWVDLRERFSIAELGDSGPALTLVIAARAEDVRRWLEQVQPLNGGTVVAATSAVVDPSVRPYLHSGQLAGLVSGWDGGRAYVRRLERARGVEEQARSLRQVSGLNWGVGILIVAVLLGNLAGLTERRRP